MKQPNPKTATNSNSTKPQTERGNQQAGMSGGGASGKYPESSRGAFRAKPSGNESMTKKGMIAKQGTVGSTRDDSAGDVLSHNPYPNGMA